MVYDLIRDSTFGQLVNYASNGSFMPYPEQRPDFVRPLPKDLSLGKRGSDIISTYEEGNRDPDTKRAVPIDDELKKRESTIVDEPISEKIPPPDANLVDWYGDDDPDNPQNWSSAKRAFVAFTISLLTFSVYIGSAIYTASIPGLMATFEISTVHATLGLTLYILGYGLGPMLLSPFQEMAMFGRNTVYILTLFIFVVFQVPIVTASNIQTILAFRFLTGFFGSPALATGGASMGDIYPPQHLAYVIGVWALGAVAGPITGPVIGGFAAQANGWKWPMYELLWISGFAFIFLFFFFPETYGPTILLRRAQRLRKVTGNNELRTATEKASDSLSVREFLNESLVRPFVLAAEPMLLFANIYLGFVYAIFYLWFEAFPLVFVEIYHFNLGISGLPFLGFLVSGIITYTFYVLYVKYHIGGRYAKAAANGTEVAPEVRLEVGLMASIFIPTSVLIFGFASKPSIHWIVPVIGAALYLPGIFLTFQSLLMYITMAYPLHTASVLAGNDLFRSTIASVFPLFGRAFFRNLGLGGGSGLLAGLSFFLMPLYYGLIRYGPYLRQRSKYASSQ